MEIGEADGAREPFRLLQKHKLNQLFLKALYYSVHPQIFRRSAASDERGISQSHFLKGSPNHGFSARVHLSSNFVHYLLHSSLYSSTPYIVCNV